MGIGPSSGPFCLQLLWSRRDSSLHISRKQLPLLEDLDAFFHTVDGDRSAIPSNEQLRGKTSPVGDSVPQNFRQWGKLLPIKCCLL